ncbi:DUF4158 domain-containing protein [Rhodococcus opacus]|nr:DUF4158 domain-containing protein [Rhodococcus opacus]
MHADRRRGRVGAGGTQTERNLLALIVRVSPASGVFPELVDVPVAVVDHLRGGLELAEEVTAAYESDRTLWRHREFVRGRLGVVYEPMRVRRVADTAIRKAVHSKDNPADLINVALEELVRARCELPGSPHWTRW